MDNVYLEKHLRVGLPESLDLSFQIIPDYSEDQEVICGWNEDELSYILGADSQPGGYDHDFYWSGMENLLRTSASDSKLEILKSGEYNTISEMTVSYRIYRRKLMGEEEVHVYHLINNETIAYWVLTTILNLGDIFKINNDVTMIMKTAQITE